MYSSNKNLHREPGETDAKLWLYQRYKTLVIVDLQFVPAKKLYFADYVHIEVIIPARAPPHRAPPFSPDGTPAIGSIANLEE